MDRASHTHALYRDENSLFYYKLEETTRSTPYAAFIKLFHHPNDGRAAWLALSSQYNGQDKWEKELKNRMICYTPECGRDRSTPPLKSSSSSIGTHLYQCSTALNVFSTNFPQNTHKWDNF